MRSNWQTFLRKGTGPILFVLSCWLIVAILSTSIPAQFPRLPKLSKIPAKGKTQPKATAKNPTSTEGAPAMAAAAGTLTLWVHKEYPWDCPLQSEFSVNGKTINIYSADTTDSLAEYFKPGWNTITLKTTPQEPATKNNKLIFRIGPAEVGAKNKVVMHPVLWEFDNGTDWRFKDGQFSHPLGPGVKEVTLNFSVYYTGEFAAEDAELKAGDFVLKSKGNYGAAWNSSVTATVFLNGTPLNTFTTAPRQIVITPLLKQGKNEIKLVSTRIKNAIRDNDIEFEIGGPAEWVVAKNRYELGRVLQFGSMQGWKMDPKSGQLINPIKPDSETIERVIPFFLKEAPKSGGE